MEEPNFNNLFKQPEKKEVTHTEQIISPKEWYCCTQLPQGTVDYLWECIERAKEKNIDHRDQLAGNISKSIALEDPNDYLINDYFSAICRSDLRDKITDRIHESFRSAIPTIGGDTFDPYMNRLWVNFQKKHEFNPLHDHSGMFSFVIWMKIPYEHEDEKQLPWVKGSGADGAVGNFVLLDRDLRCHTFAMGKHMEGQILFFPSFMHHMVYPFYTSDEERISISGNIAYKRRQGG